MESILDQLHSILFLGDPSGLLLQLPSTFNQFNADQSHDLLKYLKATIKSKKNPPTVKLQALKILQCSMSSNNLKIITYCGKKFYNRFKIFGEYKKEINDERRGTLLFNAEKYVEKIASEEFLILLLKCIKSWNDSFGIDARGKQTEYCKLYRYLQAKNITFPTDERKKDLIILKQQILSAKKKSKKILELIGENGEADKIKKIGKSLKKHQKVLTSEIEKYMEMEDHELILELNQSLDLLSNAQSVYDSWKARMSMSTGMMSPGCILPQTCQFLDDIAPKENPFVEDLSSSMIEIYAEEHSPISLPTDREFEAEKEKEKEKEKEFTATSEWIGLGADYCRLKDQYEIAEQSSINYKNELEIVTSKCDTLLEENKNLERMLESLMDNEKKANEEMAGKMDKLVEENYLYESRILGVENSLKEANEHLARAMIEINLKNEAIEKLEGSNSALSANCKLLQQDVEKYVESEKYLQKEIKELFKRIGKRKPGRESSSISSNSETLTHNDESPTKDPKIGLVVKPGEDRANSNSILHHSDSMETEVSCQMSLIDFSNSHSFIPARVPTGKFSRADNIWFFRECMKRKHGLLFEDTKLKIWIILEGNSDIGKAEISIENKTPRDLHNVKTKIFADPLEGLSLAISQEHCEVLAKEGVLRLQIIFQCFGIFQVFPLFKISYLQENEEKSRNILLLPIAYTLFCKKPSISFIKEWDEIDECRETLGDADFDSIKQVSRHLLFNKNFEYSYTEGNGVIIATESPIGLVLALVMLKDTKLSIQVKSKDSILRELIHSLIVAQLLTES